MTTVKRVLGWLLLGFSTIAHAAATPDLAILIAPPEVVATRICATFGEQIFATQVVEGVRRRRTPQRLSTEELRLIVQKFDDAMISFCKGVTTAASGKKAEIVSLFEKYYAVPLDSYWAEFVDNPASNAWARDNTAYYLQVWSLIPIYALLKQVAPESLGAELRRPSVLHFTNVQDLNVLRKYARSATGTGDLAYRRMISLMLNDPAFSQIAPKRYRMKQLANIDIELLDRGFKVKKEGSLATSLESTIIRVDSSAQELLMPFLKKAELATSKELEDVQRNQTSQRGACLTVDEYIALIQQDNGNPQAVADKLVAQADQNNAETQFNLGTALMMLKAHPSAIKVLTRATELAPRNASAYANLATSAFYLEKCDVTISSIEKALAIGPTSNDDPWHWNRLLGRCYLRAEQYAKALAPCERMRALLPQDPRGEICVAKANLGKKNYAAATSGFLRVYNMTRENPYHMAAYIGAFTGLAKQQKLGQAVELLRLNPEEYSTQEKLERTARWAEQLATPSNREWWQF